MLAVGGQRFHEPRIQLGQAPESTWIAAATRMATGFSGGLGNTREELCGALSGGVIVIGALFGRDSLDEDDRTAIDLAVTYRERFLSTFGYTRCRDLREEVIDAPGGLNSCAKLVERAAEVLIELLDESR